MAIRLFIPKRQLAGLAQIRGLGSDVLAQAADALEQLEHPLRMEELQAKLCELMPREAAEELLRQLVSVSALNRHRDLDATQIFEGLTIGLREVEKDLRWGEAELNTWESLRPQLTRLFDLPQIHVVAKALDLSYDYANLLQTIRIITDVRPVFDADVKAIEGAVISQTLRIVYNTGDQTKTLSVAMDSLDVKHLLVSCERALEKASKAKELIEARMQVPILIAGDEDVADATD